ncbi:MAG: hypothetical protein KJ804_02750 [Proteobacteria bacterium]|nr:hypothetical protein [Pseudomonadota bacterium]MBU1057225.1 hypothetical protein [Pseudomonadota bacterium]
MALLAGVIDADINTARAANGKGNMGEKLQFLQAKFLILAKVGFPSVFRLQMTASLLHQLIWFHCLPIWRHRRRGQWWSD